MIGTLSGVIVALILYFYPLPTEDHSNLNSLAFIFVGLAALLLFIQFISLFFSWIPLQQAEQNTSSHILTLFKSDLKLRAATAWLVVFNLASLLIAIHPPFFNVVNKTVLIAIWILLFGISIDSLFYYFKRTMNYFNAFGAVHMFAQAGENCIKQEREVDLCDWLDALTEVAVKGAQSNNSPLCVNALNKMQRLGRNFLESSKSIGHSSQDAQTKEFGITDKISYTLFNLFQRMDLINEKVVDKKMEIASNHSVTNMGKLAISSAKCDMSIAVHPLHYLRLFAGRAQNKGMADVGVRASLTLLEVAKTILNEIDVTYLEIKEPFLSIVGGLEEIAKEAFKQEKSTSIKVLMDPFIQLRALFKSEKVVSHQDTPVIILDIDRVLVEFQTLETVLQMMPAMPPIPNVADEKGMGASSA